MNLGILPQWCSEKWNSIYNVVFGFVFISTSQLSQNAGAVELLHRMGGGGAGAGAERWRR